MEAESDNDDWLSDDFSAKLKAEGAADRARLLLHRLADWQEL